MDGRMAGMNWWPDWLIFNHKRKEIRKELAAIETLFMHWTWGSTFLVRQWNINEHIQMEAKPDAQYMITFSTRAMLWFSFFSPVPILSSSSHDRMLDPALSPCFVLLVFESAFSTERHGFGPVLHPHSLLVRHGEGDGRALPSLFSQCHFVTTMRTLSRKCVCRLDHWRNAGMLSILSASLYLSLSSPLTLCQSLSLSLCVSVSLILCSVTLMYLLRT